MFEPLETWRIPTNRQREELLATVMEGRAAMELYLVCDLLGWLQERGRNDEHDAVIRRIGHGMFLDGRRPPGVDRMDELAR